MYVCIYILTCGPQLREVEIDKVVLLTFQFIFKHVDVSECMSFLCVCVCYLKQFRKKKVSNLLEPSSNLCTRS